MRESPILFSGPMVRAILDGRKTVTRRIVKLRYPWEIEEADNGSKWPWHPDYVTGGEWDGWAQCPYGQAGDRLWVRETWGYRGATWTLGEDHKTLWIEYAADGGRRDVVRPKDDESGIPQPRDIRPGEDYVDDYYNGYLNRYWKQNRPSIHMPRWASRITLEVTGVRVERLQDISEADALREGLVQLPASGRFAINKGDQYFGGASHSASEVFSWLWEQINGPGSWDANPWVWAVSFRRIEQEVRAA